MALRGARRGADPCRRVRGPHARRLRDRLPLREACRRQPPDGVFTAAWFRFPQGDVAKGRARIKELLARRIATQPLSLPNAGSVFRNPEGDHAARLIESCGLKGFAIGGARVSEMHANFIVNPGGGATAADIEALIAHVREAVRAKTGVLMVPEVRVMGDPS